MAGAFISERAMMAHKEKEEVTQLLGEAAQGNQAAKEELLAIIYEELHLLAHQQLVHERPDHTLNTTALVHEAYLKLACLDRIQ